MTTWHLSADELPPPGVEVIVRSVGGVEYSAVWSGLGFWRSPQWVGFALPGFVVCWRPLPE